jgi:hypothetical protein
MALTKKIYPVLFLNSRYPLDLQVIQIFVYTCHCRGAVGLKKMSSGCLIRYSSLEKKKENISTHLSSLCIDWESNPELGGGVLIPVVHSSCYQKFCKWKLTIKSGKRFSCLSALFHISLFQLFQLFLLPKPLCRYISGLKKITSSSYTA